jgi:hypothetical protein
MYRSHLTLKARGGDRGVPCTNFRVGAKSHWLILELKKDNSSISRDSTRFSSVRHEQSASVLLPALGAAVAQCCGIFLDRQ